jgi:hypothetical protein
MPRSSGLALLVGLFAFSALAATPQSKLLPPAAAELNGIEGKLDRKLLPDGATQLEIESKQIFDLVIQNTVQLTLTPVRFKVPVGGSQEASPRDCGIYLISADGAVNFIRTLGEDLPIQCWSIDAVRLERIPEDRPLIILTGNLASGTRSWLQPVVLRWDKGAGTYKMDTVDFK